MKKRFITSIFIVLVVLGAFVSRVFNTFVFDALILFVAVMAILEVSRAISANGKYEKPLLFFLFAHIFICYLLIKIGQFTDSFLPTSRYSSYLYLSIEIPVIFIVMFVSSFFTNKITFGRMVSTAFIMFYPTSLIIFTLSINNIFPAFAIPAGTELMDVIYPAYAVTGDTQLIGFFGLAMLFATSMLSDTMAYLVGVTVKGPKLCPNLSPKKTISGAVGGLIGGFMGAMLIYMFANVPALSFLQFSGFGGIPLYHFAIMGVLGSVFTQFGDLAASYLKRACGIKDFSDAFPGHGGYMDRIDGLMFNSLFIYLYMLLFVIMHL